MLAHAEPHGSGVAGRPRPPMDRLAHVPGCRVRPRLLVNDRPHLLAPRLARAPGPREAAEGVGPAFRVPCGPVADGRGGDEDHVRHQFGWNSQVSHVEDRQDPASYLRVIFAVVRLPETAPRVRGHAKRGTGDQYGRVV